MNEPKPFSKHIGALAALFVLGDAAITEPTPQADRYLMIGYLACIPVMILLYFLSSFVCNRVLETGAKAGFVQKPLRFVLLAAAGVFALFSFASTLTAFVDFAKTLVLPRVSTVLIGSILLLTLLYILYKRQENFLKYTLIVFVPVIFFILLFFIGGWDSYEVSHILIYRVPDFTVIWQQMKPLLKNPVLPAVLLPVYSSLVLNRQERKSVTAGILIGYGVLGLMILSSVLLFGSQLASALPYPFSSGVSTVNAGRLFTRLDGFSYFCYFVCSLIKLGVCLFIAAAAPGQYKNPLFSRKQTAARQ